MPLVPLGLDFAYPAEFQNLCVVRARAFYIVFLTECTPLKSPVQQTECSEEDMVTNGD